MPQFWCFAISVQYFVQFPHFVFFSVLHHTTHLVLVVLQTSLGRHPHATMLCVRQLQLWCGLTPDHCFCRVSSQPASFSETTLTVWVKTSRAVCAPDIDYCSLSGLTWTSLVRLSLDLPIVFESFFCQLPQVFSQLSSHPISFE